MDILKRLFVIALIMACVPGAYGAGVTYLCPTDSTGRDSDPVNKILDDAGIKHDNIHVFYGGTLAVVYLDLTTAEVNKLGGKITVVASVDGLAIAYSSTLGKYRFNATDFKTIKTGPTTGVTIK